MRPIKLKPEPADFADSVRKPGLAFLATTPNPTTAEWSKKAFWQLSLPQMRDSYDKICAYSSCWIPHATGSHSVDHFINKSGTPKMAYEWSNFRYVSSRFNSRKGVRIIADPFTMKFYWFLIDFTNLFIQPNSAILDPQELRLALQTIEFLRLNDDDELVNERYEYYYDYHNGDISFQYLERKSPFLAYEMQRQNLI